MSSSQENINIRGHGIINWNVSKEKQFITREEKLKYENEQAKRKMNNVPESQYFKSNILTKIHKDESSKPT